MHMWTRTKKCALLRTVCKLMKIKIRMKSSGYVCLFGPITKHKKDLLGRIFYLFILTKFQMVCSSVFPEA